MTKRLVKIAKELNVGTTTIVEHLLDSGFEIENKPTAKISEEMYNELLKQFSSSIAVKEKADQLILGGRSGKPEEEEETKTTKPEVSKPAAEEPKEEPAEAPPEEEAEEVPASRISEEDKPKIKLVGKIDLDKDKPAAKEEKTEEEETEDAEAGEAAPEEPAEDKKKEKEEDIVRAEAPQLKGLKILGKIDTSKLKPKKKEKKDEPKGKPVASSDVSRKKRRRKRRKVIPSDVAREQKARDRRSGKDDAKEVSSKEIEEKIKATMARISTGGKSKRQKIRRESREKKHERQDMLEQQSESKALELTEFVSVSELASLMDVPVADVITTCMNLGVIVSINQRLDAEIIELVAEEFGHEVKFISAEEQIMDVEVEEDDPGELVPRAPIVTVMGHVDHGKTSLLDYIRAANVVSGEAGGITQHIGAYEVKVGDDQKRITFLDTPGHEAFTAMRARGAKVTDIVVIIVAADDNVMPQTKEAISHAQAAGVPIVFAINKIDKPGADPERIKQELANMNFLVEEWGGKYQSQDISAKNGTNIDELLEKILLEAELLELKANPDRNAVGTVIEASLDKGRGYVTKLLIQNGTLEIGDTIVAGEFSGKIKAMFNELGKKVKSAGPSNPVLVLGMDGAPQAGETFKEMDSEQDARRLAAQRAQIAREQTTRASKRVSLDEIGRRLALGTFKELNLIVKGDVDGSVEALSDALIKQTIETVKVNVIHKAVGGIVESDVLLATASDAIIIGFQVRPSMGARKLAEKEGIEIKTYSVIYEAIDEVKSAIEGMLEPTKEERVTGQLEVREIYKISRVGTIAGCYVHEGKITRNSLLRVIRDGIVIYPTKEGVTGEVDSLKRFKDDVKEVKAGLECGVSVKNFNDLKVGDFIETYEIEMIKQTLDA